MLSVLKKYKLTFLFVYITLWTALASTPMNEVFHFPKIATQFFSLMLYVPFFLLILYKFVKDLQCFRLHGANILYYLFAIYYVILSGVRLLNGTEVKESIYYTVVLLGCFALFLMLSDGVIRMSPEQYQRDLFAIGAYIIVLKLLFVFLEGGFFSLPPVNNLYSTSMLVMLLPFMVCGFQKNKGLRGRLLWFAYWLSVALILVCSSRAITLLAFAVLGVSFFLILDKHWNWLKFLSGLLCAVLLVSLLAACNVGLVRRSLYRGFGIVIGNTSDMQTGTPNDGIEDEFEMQVNIDSQIDRSDSMRADLQKTGIAEIKKNPIFGTGDLYYTYDMGYKTMEQTAHNFILECLVCYGALGLLMIGILLLLILIRCGFLQKPSRQSIAPAIGLLLVMLHYFALGFVQPSVFNTLLCPLFFILVAYYGTLLPQRSTAACKSFSFLKLGKDSSHGSEE